MTAAYYNEIDPFAAEWLRRLILFGHIAPGDVDERDIRDVSPDDLRGYEQHHFFAGIGVWSYALRRAGWADEQPVATGSCPCQPFSAAGGRGGVADERHLWPAFFHLIRECGFPVVVGEQVASKDGLGWLDLVSADMEGAGYTGGALDLCSAGFGSPNIRQRLYFAWLADAARKRREGAAKRTQSNGGGRLEQHGEAGGLAHTASSGGGTGLRDSGSTEQRGHVASDDGRTRALADADVVGSGEERQQRSGELRGLSGNPQAGVEHGDRERVLHPGPVNGFWRDADWLLCRDVDGPKWRAVEAGTFPLAYGLTGRVGSLRAYGNAINGEVATGFIEAVMESIA